MITDKVVEVVVTFSLSAYKEFPIGGNREVYDPEPRPWPHKQGTSRTVLPGFLYLEDSGSSWQKNYQFRVRKRVPITNA